MVSHGQLDYKLDLLFRLTRPAAPCSGASPEPSHGRVGNRSLRLGVTFGSPHLGGIHVDDS